MGALDNQIAGSHIGREDFHAVDYIHGLGLTMIFTSGMIYRIHWTGSKAGRMYSDANFSHYAF